MQNQLLMKQTNSIFSTLILLVILTAFGSCKSKKITDSNLSSLNEKNAFEYFYRQMHDFDSFDSAATISVSGDLGNHRFKCILRGEKDSIVWGSVQKFGLELARFSVTREKFELVNRLERTYISEDLSYVKNILGVDFSFKQIWDILLGLPPYHPPKKNKSTETENQYLFDFQTDNINNTVKIRKNNALADQFKVTSPYSENITAVIQQNLEDYKIITDYKYFSYIRTLDVDIPTVFKGNFRINFDQIKPDAPINVKFEIPTNYKKTAL